MKYSDIFVKQIDVLALGTILIVLDMSTHSISISSSDFTRYNKRLPAKTNYFYNSTPNKAIFFFIKINKN